MADISTFEKIQDGHHSSKMVQSSNIFGGNCQPPSLSAALDSWGSQSNRPYVQFMFDFLEIYTIIGRTALHGAVGRVNLWWDRWETGHTGRMGEGETCSNWDRNSDHIVR